MKNQYKSSLKLINQISKIRSKNNKNWMDILKLAFNKDQKMHQKFSLELLILIREYQS